ncbi:MAG: hypothetical protein GX414_03675 [Acidobacteria bacterium]|nr:hypothetical protein [Acidobacteriota bacterium]
MGAEQVLLSLSDPPVRILYSSDGVHFYPHHRFYVTADDIVEWYYRPAKLGIHFVGVSPLVPHFPVGTTPGVLKATVANAPPESGKYFVALYDNDHGTLVPYDPEMIVNPGGGTGK